MKKTIVIVGGVAGGASAAARLRRISEDTEIIMFEKGEFISFANCGLPYYIGGSIVERDALLVQTVEGMSERFNIDIRNYSEVKSIDRENKSVSVLNIKENKSYEQSYDVLLLSPGASPIKPPIAGLEDSKNVFTLRNIPDTDVIKDFVDNKKPKRATVIGGGFIGVEMAENLTELGIKVTLIEATDQVMAPFDREMAAIIHNHLRENNVDLILGDGVKQFEEEGRVIVTSSGRKIETDLTIMSIGVKPDSQIAVEAGLKTGKKGHIIVDEHMRTSDENIFAVGDVIEFKDYIFKEPMSLALASPANRQARIAANVIMGKEDVYKGFLGSSVAKIFDLTAASTGWNEKRLKAENKNFDSVTVELNNHAGYYPGAEPIHLKVLYEVPTGRVLGGQSIGALGAEKRIDVLATAIQANMTVDDLTDLELSYAPPYSSAKDPVNMAGYVAQNKLESTLKDVSVLEIDEIAKDKNAYVIDVREPEEVILGTVPGAVNIPMDDLRKKVDEIPKDKDVYITCQVGRRGYFSCRLLNGLGVKATNLAGGYSLYREQYGITASSEESNQLEDLNVSCADNPDILKKNYSVNKSVDARGLQCPGPIAATYKALEELNDGDILEVKASEPGFKRDIGAWSEKTGNRLVSLTKEDTYYRAIISKGRQEVKTLDTKSKDGATMVVFSGDLDKAMASLIIATGAASMGKEVTMFFTFWGLNILRKKGVSVEKDSMEKMFSMMMPEGISELKLSKMNMAGMGTTMMKKVMDQKNVDSPEKLLKQAREMGVNLVACAMSMDIMGIKEEELIDGVEVAGVATYLARTEEAGLNLFI